MINPAKSYTLDEYIEILRRRIWYIVIPFVLIVVGASIYAFLAPRQYKASTLVLVSPQRVPEAYVQATVTSRVEAVVPAGAPPLAVETVVVLTVTVDTEGRVVINDQPRFRLLRGAMADRTAFQSEGSNLFKWDHGVVDLERSGKVKIGFVEKPNFSVVQEMVKMIEVARAYEANAKCVQTHDSLLDRCINSVGPTRR